METTHMLIDRRMKKENVVCTYNGILFSLKKRNPVICNNMNEHVGYYEM